MSRAGAWLAAWLLALGIVGGCTTPEAHAEVSARCWAHLAEIPAGETPAGDVRYHRMRGEFSPCTEQEAAEASGSSSRSSDSGERREEKSRYCKKRWFC